MIRINRTLSNRQGNASLYGIVLVLSLLIIFSGISEYMRLKLIAEGIRDALQTAITSVAISNYDDLYNGLREGYSGGYKLSSTDQWVESLDVGNIYDELDVLLNTDEETSYHIKKTAEGGIEYKLSNLDVQIMNSSLAPVGSDSINKFQSNASIRLEVPMSFGWDMLPPMVIHLKVKAAYGSKF